MAHPDEIAQRFRLLRGLKNFREIAVQAGVTNGQWHNWEKGKNVPTLRSVRAVAAKLSVDPQWILEGKGNGPRAPEPFRVGEEDAVYETLDAEARRILKEIERFLKVASRQKKEHLLRLLRWLREAEEAKGKK